MDSSINNDEANFVFKKILNLYDFERISKETQKLTNNIYFYIYENYNLDTNYKKVLCILTCFWIAFKFHESDTINISTLIELAFNKISYKTFIKTEIEILKIIKFKLLFVYSSTELNTSSFK